MHAFLVSANPYPNPEPDTLILAADKPSIGIEEVRDLQSFLSRKPTKNPRNVAVIIDAHKLTLPAQNALLKTLEEPPGDSQIYLVTTKPDLLLPTITSRVESQITPHSYRPDEADIKKNSETWNFLLQNQLGKNLAHIDTRSFTRESALTFLDHLEYLFHTSLTNQPKITQIYPLIVQTRKHLNANVNIRLCLDHFVIDICKLNQ